MSIADKLTAVAENVPKVFAAGARSEYDRFWDAYQENGSRTDYARAFAGIGWTDETFKPKYPIPAMTIAEQMFNMTGITVIEHDLDFSKINAISYLFWYGKNLKRIKSIIFKTDTAQAVFPFVNCNALSDITIKGNIGFSLNFQWSPLSVESMKSIIGSLVNYIGTEHDHEYTITFSDTCWAALEADNSAPNGDTWKTYVDLQLGWNV